MEDVLSSIQDLHPRWQYRHLECRKYFVPFLAENGLNAKSRVVEVGCGQGPKSLAIAAKCKEVFGFDLSESHIEIANRIAQGLNVKNAHFYSMNVTAANDLLESLNRNDFVLCYAILEHLLPDEREALFRMLSKCLQQGVRIAFAETPNRIAPIDHHSSFLPFFDTLPEHLALRYGKHSARPWYAEFMQAPQTEQMYRHGRGLSFHDFELGFDKVGRLGDIIQADGWSLNMLNMHPHFGYEVALLESYGLLRPSAIATPTAIPPLFFRYWLEGILSNNPKPQAASAPQQLVYTGENSRTFTNTDGVLRVTIPAGASAQFRFQFNQPAAPCEVILPASTRHEGEIRLIDSDGQSIETEIRNDQEEFDKWRLLRYSAFRFENFRSLRIENKGKGNVAVGFPLVRKLLT